MSATTSLPWSIHLTGSLSIFVRPSTRMPPMNRNTDAITRPMPALVGRPPSLTTIRSTSDSPRSSVGLVHSRMPRIDAGSDDADVDQHEHADRRGARRSRGSSAPCESWSARKATTPAIAATISGGARFDTRLGDRVLVVVEHLFLLDPVVDLDREVDPEPDQDRQTRDGDEAEVDADQARRSRTSRARRRSRRAAAAAASGPGTSGRGSTAITPSASAPRVSMPPLQVVVDLLEVDGRAGDGQVEAVELGAVEDLEDLLRSPPTARRGRGCRRARRRRPPVWASGNVPASDRRITRSSSGGGASTPSASTKPSLP